MKNTLHKLSLSFALATTLLANQAGAADQAVLPGSKIITAENTDLLPLGGVECNRESTIRVSVADPEQGRIYPIFELCGVYAIKGLKVLDKSGKETVLDNLILLATQNTVADPNHLASAGILLQGVLSEKNNPHIRIESDLTDVTELDAAKMNPLNKELLKVSGLTGKIYTGRFSASVDIQNGGKLTFEFGPVVPAKTPAPEKKPEIIPYGGRGVSV